MSSGHCTWRKQHQSHHPKLSYHLGRHVPITAQAPWMSWWECMWECIHTCIHSAYIVIQATTQSMQGSSFSSFLLSWWPNRSLNLIFLSSWWTQILTIILLSFVFLYPYVPRSKGLGKKKKRILCKLIVEKEWPMLLGGFVCLNK